MKHLINCINTIQIGVKKKELYVTVFLTKFNLLVLWNLYKNGFIVGYKINNATNTIIVYLKYLNGKNALENLKIISKVSKRVYMSVSDIKKNKNSYIVSTTSKGIKISNIHNTNSVGGEILFKIK
jgi:ribosomal protein S8